MKSHSYQHKVQYYETDQMGMVHHSNYIRWFEEARIDFLEAVGLPYEAMEEAGIAIPVLSVQCQYKTRTHFAEVVTVEVGMKEYNGLRMQMTYVVTGPDGTVRCTGESGHCFVNQKGRPTSLKKANPEWHAKIEQIAADMMDE